jgi:sulfite exporter TauE/SafE
MMSLWAAFTLGLFGGLHCAGMCGPLMLALPSGPSARWRFVAGRLVYQGGRILAYSALGLLFGLAGAGLHLAGLQRWTSIALGVALIAGATVGTTLPGLRHFAPGYEWLGRWMSLSLRRRTFGSLAVLGLLNGLLPCGLVYVAGAGAIAAGGVMEAVEFMAAFGLGTVPTLLAISFTGRLIPPAARLRMVRLVPVSMALVGALLILRGLGWGFPLISPGLGKAGHAGPACHGAGVVADAANLESHSASPAMQ